MGITNSTFRQRVGTAAKQRIHVVFIVGSSGAGKSTVRRRLTSLLSELSIETSELTDYVYIYAEYLREAILGFYYEEKKFKSAPEGAFEVQSERELEGALDELAREAHRKLTPGRILLIEFARSDIGSALSKFHDDILRTSWVINVEAPFETRLTRLRNRKTPPEITVVDMSVILRTSDDHPVPESALVNLYSSNSAAPATWSGLVDNRVFRISNDEHGDDRFLRLDRLLLEFLEVVSQP